MNKPEMPEPFATMARLGAKLRAEEITARRDDYISPEAAARRERVAEARGRLSAIIETEKQPAQKLPMKEAILLKILMECGELDKKTRRPKPTHAHVFRAAWVDGLNGYQMEKRCGWPRRTAETRLRAIEKKCLNGRRVASYAYDPGILKNVEAQLAEGRSRGVRIDKASLLR